ncbi:MAG: hypothetical protein U0903_17180 [Planctomycetales bacterium]
MLHFSCDLCGTPLHDERHVVKMEIYPATEPRELTEEDLDVDQLEAVSQLLSDLEEGEAQGEPCEHSGARYLRFDLCAACREKFLRDPLGREGMRRMKFSKN